MCSFHHLPTEIIYFYIIPFIPVYGISNKDLKLQKKKIKLVSYIQKILEIDNTDPIKFDILKNYQGELDYSFQDTHTYLYINLRNRNDFIYIIN